MKWLFVSVCAALIVWSFQAWRMIPKPPSDKVVITWVTDDNPVRREQAALFNSRNRDVEVRLDPTNIGMEKVVVQCLGGVGPDVFDIFNRSQLQDYARAGVLLPLDGLAADWGISPAHTWPQIRDDISYEHFDTDTGDYHRVQYAFPCSVSAAVMFYNKRLFDEAGLAYPTSDWTWDECLEMARRLVRRDETGRIVQYGLCTYDYPEIFELFWQFGASVYDSTRTYCTLDSPDAIKALTFFQEMVRGPGRVMPSLAEREAFATQGGWGGSNQDIFAQQRVAMMRIGRFGLITFRRYYDAPNEKSLRGRIGVVQMPWKKEKAVLATSRCCGINRNSPRRQEALKFLQFLASPEYSELVAGLADSLPPRPQTVAGQGFLSGGDFPEEDFNHVFVEAMHRGRRMEFCPFVQPARVERTIVRHLALLSEDKIIPERAATALTEEINADIRMNLSRYASMRAEYRKLTGRQYDPNRSPP